MNYSFPEEYWRIYFELTSIENRLISSLYLYIYRLKQKENTGERKRRRKEIIEQQLEWFLVNCKKEELFFLFFFDIVCCSLRRHKYPYQLAQYSSSLVHSLLILIIRVDYVSGKRSVLSFSLLIK